MTTKFKITIKVRELRRPAHDFDVPFKMELTEDRYAESALVAFNRTAKVAKVVCASDQGTESIVEELRRQGHTFPGGDRRPPRGYFVFEGELGQSSGFYFTTPLDNDLEQFCDRVEGSTYDEEEGGEQDEEPCYESYEEACGAAWEHADDLWLGAPPDLPAIPKYSALPRGYHVFVSRQQAEGTDPEELCVEWVWQGVAPATEGDDPHDCERFGEFRGFWDGEDLSKAVLDEIRRMEGRTR